MNVIPDVGHSKVGDSVDGLGHGIDGVHGEVWDGGDGLGHHVNTRHCGVWAQEG